MSISHVHHLLAGWPWASYITSLSQSLSIKEESNSAHLTDCLEDIMPLNLLTQYQTLSNSKIIAWYCFHSVSWSCLTLCNPMDCSTPGFPVLPSLLELAQIHVHWINDTIQPSYPLPPSSPLALNFLPASGSFPMSQLFASGGQSIGVS